MWSDFQCVHAPAARSLTLVRREGSPWPYSDPVATSTDDWPVPIPADRVPVYRSYGLQFAEDGCPMSTKGGKLTFHPLIPAYLIADFVNAYETTHDHEYLSFARSFADHAFAHAQPLDNALVWEYRAGEAASSFTHSYYSGLTQAWYLKSLCMLAKHADGLDDAITSVFAALRIPAAAGGVLLERDYGSIIEEYPHEPPLFTLNGWLTAIKMIIGARGRLDALGLDYVEFVGRNLDAVEHLLPLFDAEFCLNSRYQLTGFTRVRLEYDTDVRVSVADFAVSIPGEGRYPATPADSSGTYRWLNHVEREEPGLTQLNVVLSLASHPRPNSIDLNLEVDTTTRAEVFVADGEYRPDMTAAPTERWQRIGELQLAPGAEPLCVDVPWGDKNLFAYPTNFKKTLGDGSFFNSYHYIHILALAGLYADWDQRPALKEWALRWLGYAEHWQDLDFLREGPYELESHRYGREFRPLIESLLADPS